MAPQRICDGITWVGAIDWDRRLFDELIPLSNGTTYNAYLVEGTEKTVLVDTVDPAFTATLLGQLDQLGVKRLDHVVSNHAEQDHSGSIPAVLARYPEATVLATSKGKGMLGDLLGLAPERVTGVDNGATLDLGGKTLRFVHFPWVHWPETMLTYVEQDRLLLSCDLFGAHLTAPDLRSVDLESVLRAARGYFAEIMMPYRGMIEKNLSRVTDLALDTIAPSHGPLVHDPQRMIDAYRSWISDTPRNLAVIAYVSMHASTKAMVLHLADALASRGVGVELLNLTLTDLGRIARALVDAATLVLGSPTVLLGAHPVVANAAFTANALQPKVRFVAIVGSLGWGGKMVEQLQGLMPALKAESLGTVLVKGHPKATDLQALDQLAEEIAKRHRELGLA